MKKQHEIQALTYALAIIFAITFSVRSDMASVTGEMECRIAATSDSTGFLLPADEGDGSTRDTGNIYADTPQLAVPRNTSVSGQPRQHPTAKRTVPSVLAGCTLKDGKIITGNTVTHYLSNIGLFPSGIRDDKTRLLSLRKLII